MYNNIKEKWDKFDIYTKGTIITITIAIILRFTLASVSIVTGDPCWFINVARFIAENGKIPLFEALGRPVFWPPPLFHLTAASLYKFFGSFGQYIADRSIMLISPIFGSLSLVFTFLLSKKMFNTKVAFFSVLFLSFVPTHLYHSAIPYMATMVSFFVIASIYYLLEKRFYISGILAGLAISTKFTGFFLLPVILIILLYEKKEFWKKLFKFTIPCIIFGSPWYIRNWIVLGNPVWPHLSSLFGNKAGELVVSYGSFHGSLLNLFNTSHYIKMYLAMYGVPAGNIENFMLIKIPFILVFVGIWVVATIIFTFPLIYGIIKSTLKDKKNVILLSWFLAFLGFASLNIIINGGVWLRHSLPFMSAIAIFWGIGLNKMKFSKMTKTLTVIFLICCFIGFIGTEFFKAYYVNDLWDDYRDDFSWVNKNTSKEGTILVPYGDCYAYNFHRFTKEFYSSPYIDSIEKIGQEEISYIWVNGEMDFYGWNNYSSAYPYDFLEEVDENYKKIYENKDTKTIVYKVR